MSVWRQFDRKVFTWTFQFVLPAWCVVMLLVSNGCGKPTRQPATQQDHEVLALSPQTVVIERSSTDDAKAVVLSIKNVSAQAIEISASPATCACTVVSPLKSSHLLPGQSTELKLSGHPPIHGQSTATFTLKTSHPLLPIVQIPVVLRGMKQTIPYVLSKPDSVQLSLRGGQSTAKTRWTVSCLERLTEEPWLRGFTVEDSRIEISEPVVEDTQPTSVSTLIRHYTFEATFHGTAEDANGFKLSLKWLVKDEGAITPPNPLLLAVDSVPYVRVVPDPVVFDVSAASVATVERKCLVFFDAEIRHRLDIAQPLPAGISVLIDPDLLQLPANAVRLILRIDPRLVRNAAASDPSMQVLLPVMIEDQPHLKGVINLRMVRRP